ncbi:hypothetical protein COU62_00530 [Candidatus Pacearchaeota archaeon CG10_big_fil_rev_8_21_14_0_10_35_219]|nr:hypothetical protein [Candidatus Pacearchaeota archaeon]OIO42700.1 MAG: hypothetical protein AUJ63_02195 [Candidatus Pacearchaeota archaeon CG1_02_35_32]PIO08276.1 MAG: hypothetical protein COU62_00530 [Candidatus Pacearchaeota archaeon CG10_big_fil_rev_8_21_14_0_10_35_219]PIY81877.1 MAG: hypothetical protein COY79_00270 [Candidatus Pacearchaeota archaeon CG_4_10_14_0_8_um_filter_35_169]PIZ79382.1 MAG: hypothetical protein COY00_04365 [Candidatus Pacearchaeota archaeon CG_4_10_14_0_2_um_filt
MKRGQISVEYLIVVGFVIFLVLSVLGVAFYYSSALRDSIKFYQLKGYANKAISSAESVFFAGEPSKSTFTAYLPDGVSQVYAYEENDDYSLVFVISSSGGDNVISYPSDVRLMTEGLTITQGVKRIEAIAYPDYALLREAN